MASANISDFKEIVRDIDNKKILLPDFQRDFVWKDEERQKKIVASVLTKMPIGSILLLTSSADEYCSKVIGKNADLDASDIVENVDFLLDGQQRITVLTNVFSNVIHDNCERYLGKTISNDYIDTLRLARKVFPDWKHRRLSDLAEHYGISTVGAHRALADCRMNQKIFEYLGKELAGKQLKVQNNIRICPKCHLPMQRRNGRFGEFWGCTGFPKCRHTENV